MVDKTQEEIEREEEDVVVEESDEGKDAPIEDTDPSTPEEKARARNLGWVAEADWDEARAERDGRRKPSHFLTAREYLEQTEDSVPIMRERLRKLEGTNRELLGKVDDMHGIVTTQQQMTREAVKRAHARGIADAEQRMRDAVSSGEQSDYDQAKADLDALHKTPVVEEERPKPQERRQADPVAENWVARNPWFNEDHVLQNAMIVEDIEYRRTHPDVTTAQSYEASKKLVMKRYPERFGINPRRDAPSTVSGSSGVKRNGTGFDALPQEAKDAYERFRKISEAKGDKYTKEEYMADYAL